MASGCAASSFSKAARSAPVNLPSTHAVNCSSNGFIDVFQQGLEFLAGVKQAGHDGTERTAHLLGDLGILETIDFAHDDGCAMLGRKLRDGLIDTLADLLV